MYDLVIKNGTTYTCQGFVKATLGIQQGRLAAIAGPGAGFQGDETIDARGRHVLPGMVDMHVHFRDPGATASEDFETGTLSAAAGGVTTVAEMPNTVPPVTSAQAFIEKKNMLGPKAVVDFCLVAGAGTMSEEALISLADVGAVAFKTFMISRFKELSASDYQMLDNFRVISRTGRPVLVHAENEDIVTKGVLRARALGRTDPMAHSDFRPPIAEVEATMRTALMALETGVRLHVCHMTARGAVDVVEWAKGRGIAITGETSPNYLLLNSEALNKHGPYAKCDPPLRLPGDQKRLWEGIQDGTIDALASDHAPYPVEEKERGWRDIFDAPSGGIGVELSLPLMLDCINRRKLTLERLVEIFSANPARILGLYPRKGSLQIGSDADIAIVDAKKAYTVRGEDLHSRQKRTAFEGYEGKGCVQTVIVRGSKVFDDGEAVGRPGNGQFLEPQSGS